MKREDLPPPAVAPQPATQPRHTVERILAIEHRAPNLVHFRVSRPAEFRVTPGHYGFVHWVLYNIPASATGLQEGISPQDLPSGTLEGLSDWKRTGWGGPYPPKGRHRYFFKLYALDTVLPDLHHPTKSKLEAAMDGHIVARAELIGTYEKAKKGFVNALFGR